MGVVWYPAQYPSSYRRVYFNPLRVRSHRIYRGFKAQEPQKPYVPSVCRHREARVENVGIRGCDQTGAADGSTADVDEVLPGLGLGSGILPSVYRRYSPFTAPSKIVVCTVRIAKVSANSRVLAVMKLVGSISRPVANPASVRVQVTHAVNQTCDAGQQRSRHAFMVSSGRNIKIPCRDGVGVGRPRTRLTAALAKVEAARRLQVTPPSVDFNMPRPALVIPGPVASPVAA